jgi:predicted transcriptional regulator
MDIKELVDRFGLKVVAGRGGLGRTVRGGYCGDLLSNVMANAPIGCVWLTVQGHQNIVAVAVLREMAAVVITAGQPPDQDTIAKADREGIPVLTCLASTYDLAGRLYTAGVTNSPA